MATNIQRIVDVYLKIRDKRAALKREFEDQDKNLKAQQERLETELLRFLDATGMDSAKTPSGTVFRQRDMIPQAADWEAVYAWIKENDAFDILERRLKKTFVKEYMDNNDGALPPGVNVFQKFDVQVRRASN